MCVARASHACLKSKSRISHRIDRIAYCRRTQRTVRHMTRSQLKIRRRFDRFPYFSAERAGNTHREQSEWYEIRKRFDFLSSQPMRNRLLASIVNALGIEFPTPHFSAPERTACPKTNKHSHTHPRRCVLRFSVRFHLFSSRLPFPTVSFARRTKRQVHECIEHKCSVCVSFSLDAAAPSLGLPGIIVTSPIVLGNGAAAALSGPDGAEAREGREWKGIGIYCSLRADRWSGSGQNTQDENKKFLEIKTKCMIRQKQIISLIVR